MFFKVPLAQTILLLLWLSKNMLLTEHRESGALSVLPVQCPAHMAPGTVAVTLL